MKAYIDFMTQISELIPHIEALIFASDKPLTSAEITDLINAAFGFMEDKIVVEQIDASLEGIVEKYNSEFYPFEVRQSGGGWQFLTKKDYHKTVAQLNGEKFLKRLSAAALETLAIIAYKQPVTKGEIESIRGVSSDYAVQKLLEKELIIIAGRNEKLPGHPLIYTTSKTFMDYFGINSPEDLPKIKEVLADQVVQPTLIKDTDFESSGLIVTGEGELIGEEVINNPSTDATETFINGQPVAQNEVPVDDELIEEEADETDLDSLSEDDFPEEEQREMEIEQTSDEIIFTPDEIQGEDLTKDQEESEAGGEEKSSNDTNKEDNS
ncbi:MAG: chromosome segregation and condensation protein ScpB [Flaviaesturariibacter sp.]|nr:chromosome segregation and condensation protein ScpB [Flaviaesturariibacter sp.]